MLLAMLTVAPAAAAQPGCQGVENPVQEPSLDVAWTVFNPGYTIAWVRTVQPGWDATQLRRVLMRPGDDVVELWAGGVSWSWQGHCGAIAQGEFDKMTDKQPVTLDDFSRDGLVRSWNKYPVNMNAPRPKSLVYVPPAQPLLPIVLPPLLPCQDPGYPPFEAELGKRWTIPTQGWTVALVLTNLSGFNQESRKLLLPPGIQPRVFGGGISFSWPSWCEAVARSEFAKINRPPVDISALVAEGLVENFQALPLTFPPFQGGEMCVKSTTWASTMLGGHRDSWRYNSDGNPEYNGPTVDFGIPRWGPANFVVVLDQGTMAIIRSGQFTASHIVLACG